MKCEYCGTENEKSAKKCRACSASIKEEKQDYWKSDPIFYNGYICYFINNFPKDTREVQFWLGRELIERIEVSNQVLEYHVPQGFDFMSFFWELFLVAHGEKEVLEWQEKNTKYPATFEIRRIENSEKERLRSLSLRDLAMESRR